jgi:hypothetical protein
VERVLVGLVAATLLLRANPGRSDYIFVCQLPSPGSSDGQFPISRSLRVDSEQARNVPDALHRQVRVFLGRHPFLVKFSELGNEDKEPAEPNPAFLPTLGNPIPGNWLRIPSQQVLGGGPIFGDFAGFTVGILLINGTSHADAELVADTIDHGGEISTGNYSFLRRFGGLDLGETQPAAPPRVVAGTAVSVPVSSPLYNSGVVCALCFLALGLFGTLGFGWRERKRRLHRFLRGPRRTTLYRSPSLPPPPGKAL